MSNNKSIIIIGKGTSILNSTKEFVDKFDYVAICNHPVFGNYEKYISNRAHYDFCNTGDIDPYSDKQFKNLGIKYVINTGGKDTENKKINKKLINNAKYINDGRSKFLKFFKDEHNLDPSTGTLALEYILTNSEYNFNIIGLIGFDLMYKNEKNYYLNKNEVKPSLHRYYKNNVYDKNGIRLIETGHNYNNTLQYMNNSFKKYNKKNFFIISNRDFNNLDNVFQLKYVNINNININDNNNNINKYIKNNTIIEKNITIKVDKIDKIDKKDIKIDKKDIKINKKDIKKDIEIDKKDIKKDIKIDKNIKINNLIRNSEILLNDRIDFLKKLPNNKIVAEIGVQYGNNAINIYKHTKPQKLYLIDSWNDINGVQNLKKVNAYFKDINNVEIIKDLSLNIVKSFDNNYFDWVYIDAAKDYKNVKNDINEWSKKIKKGGYICGHDYINFPKKNFGIVQAVNEFLDENNYKLLYLSKIKQKTCPNAPDWCIQIT